MKFLLIEDDPELSAYVAAGLAQHGYAVEIVSDGKKGLSQGSSGAYDLIVADRRLPGIDGLTLVRSLRMSGIRTPVIFLTTVSGLEDRVEGLNAGADDYLVKPFAFSELLARIQALLRRSPSTEPASAIRIADLEIDLIHRRVVRAGQTIDLLPREFDLLHYLASNAGKVVTRSMLLEHVWDFHFDPKTSVVETHISRLRAKIDRAFNEPLIHTIPRAGYSLHA
jgi:two-component system OmpR family response regulator